jgi:hypothetical protein
VLLYRSEVRMIPLDLYFSFKTHLKFKFFQNVVRLGTLYPWISPRRRISRRAEHPHGALREQIPLSQKKAVSSGALRISNTARANTRQFALQEILLSAEIRIPPVQFSPEHPPPKSSRIPQEKPLLSSCRLLPPRWSKLLCGKS